MRSIICILSLMFTIASSLPAPSSLPSHPGCTLLWFLPDCPLARVVGVDPFDIYQWEDLCEKYEAFALNEKCLEKNQKDDVQMEVFEAVPQMFELSRNLQQLSNKSELSVTQRRNMPSTSLGDFSVTRE